MGKKIAEEMAKERPKFIEGAKATHNIDAKKAGEVFDLLEKFANYGFNKSHAAAYAVVSYQTAYLKANYPVEFMAAVMNCDIHLTDKLAVYKREVDKLGITTVPPCVNRSLATFTVVDGQIVYALGALKNVGVDAMRLIVEITETVAIRDIDETAKFVAAVRDLGARVALDDFGTGYSSLSYLRGFPFDKLKIDRRSSHHSPPIRARRRSSTRLWRLPGRWAWKPRRKAWRTKTSSSRFAGSIVIPSRGIWSAGPSPPRRCRACLPRPTRRRS